MSEVFLSRSVRAQSSEVHGELLIMSMLERVSRERLIFGMNLNGTGKRML